MGPEVLRTRFMEIEEQAEHDKAGVQFIIGYIEANEPAVREAFGVGDDQSSEADSLMYEEIKLALGWIQAEMLKPLRETHQIKPNKLQDQTPHLTSLGLAVYLPMFRKTDLGDPEKPHPYILMPTVKGIMLTDQYRQAMGMPTLTDEIEFRRQAQNP